MIIRKCFFLFLVAAALAVAQPRPVPPPRPTPPPPHVVPEVDPASAASAIALLGGALFVVRARSRR